MTRSLPDRSNRIPRLGLIHPFIFAKVSRKFIVCSQIAGQVDLVGVVNVVFVDPVFLVELEFLHHFLRTVARREDLEDNLGRDAILLELFVHDPR